MSEESNKVVHTEAEWRSMLTTEQYHVLREKGTERAFTGILTENHETGDYHCAGCGAMLFMSGAKFDSGCGWPRFMLPADSNAVVEHEDRSFGMRRIEVTCARCGGHLGHVEDGRFVWRQLALHLGEVLRLRVELTVLHERQALQL